MRMADIAGPNWRGFAGKSEKSGTAESERLDFDSVNSAYPARDVRSEKSHANRDNRSRPTRAAGERT